MMLHMDLRNLTVWVFGSSRGCNSFAQSFEAQATSLLEAPGSSPICLSAKTPQNGPQIRNNSGLKYAIPDREVTCHKESHSKKGNFLRNYVHSRITLLFSQSPSWNTYLECRKLLSDHIYIQRGPTNGRKGRKAHPRAQGLGALSPLARL